MGSVRVAIVGVGNCAASLVQGVHYYRDADPSEVVPGLMHVAFGEYHVYDVEFVAAFDVDDKKVGKDLSEAIGASENNTIKICDVPDPRHRGAARPHPRRPRQVLPDDHRGVRGRAGRHRPRAARVRGRRPRLLPAGGLGGGRQVLRPVRDRRRRRLRQRAPGLHRLRPRVGREVRGRRRPDHRRRHQVAGRRDHHPPGAGQAVRGPRRRARPHLPAQRRRQHGLQEHARARAPGVQEGLQDPGRHLQPHRRAGQQDLRPQRAHRPVRLRPVARRPQVGLRPPRGSRLRRRAAQHGVQARGLGLPQLRRHHHRRHPRGEDRQGPRHRWPADRRVVVPDEEPAGAAARRGGPPPRRGLHRRRASNSRATPRRRPSRSASRALVG